MDNNTRISRPWGIFVIAKHFVFIVSVATYLVMFRVAGGRLGGGEWGGVLARAQFLGHLLGRAWICKGHDAPGQPCAGA